MAEGDGELLIENAAVSLDAKATIAEGRGHRFFAGWRSDLFFFDPPERLPSKTSIRTFRLAEIALQFGPDVRVGILTAKRRIAE